MGFRIPPAPSGSEPVEIPAVVPSGAVGHAIRRDFAALIDLRDSDRFESDLLAWLMLWRLVRLARVGDRARQAGTNAVQPTLRRIREHLADGSLSPESLARSVGLSRRRLDQLFTQTVGKPVAACIRDRRRQLATDLLCHTSLPIALIGGQVGIPDPHAFNKFIHRTCAMSPSDVRNAECPQSRDRAKSAVDCRF